MLSWNLPYGTMVEESKSPCCNQFSNELQVSRGVSCCALEVGSYFVLQSWTNTLLKCFTYTILILGWLHKGHLLVQLLPSQSFASVFVYAGFCALWRWRYLINLHSLRSVASTYIAVTSADVVLWYGMHSMRHSVQLWIIQVSMWEIVVACWLQCAVFASFVRIRAHDGDYYYWLCMRSLKQTLEIEFRLWSMFVRWRKIRRMSSIVALARPSWTYTWNNECVCRNEGRKTYKYIDVAGTSKP